MSDWGGTNSSIESIEAGCDIEMPVGDFWRGKKVLQAVESGQLSQEAVEKAAANVLYLVERTKGTDMSIELDERENDREETRQLIRNAGVEGITLLKNEGGLLPVKPSEIKIAVIGPNANRAIAGGGGSASLNPYYNTLPLDSISAVPGKDIVYAQGCHTYKWLPLAADFCTTSSGEQGVIMEWYEGDKFEGIPRVIQRRPNTDLFLWDSVPLEVVGRPWSVQAKTRITPVTSGRHTLSFSTVGPGRLLVDGKVMVDLWDWTEQGEAMFDNSQDILFDMQLEAGKPIEVIAETTNEIRPIWKQKPGATHKTGGVRIGYKEEDKQDLLQEAIEAAKASDVAIVIVGLDGEWESEGYDRKTMNLPKDGSQDRLIDEVLKANPRTIVVNQSGSPVTMPWADRVPAIIQAWYQGQEAGNALADVLFGFKNPSGKLPVSENTYLTVRKCC
jgi:beta-glucosidase